MEMWGDAEGAYSLKQSDSLSVSLFQITGPAHIPYNDSRWQKLLLHYDQLVHLHNLGLAGPSTPEAEADVVGSACRQCAKYSSTSSNLAAFSLHVARMIRDMQMSLETYFSEAEGNIVVADEKKNSQSTGNVRPGSIKQRISLIGKARVTAGAINLLRILSHEIIVQAFSSASEIETKVGHKSAVESDPDYILKESFTYRSREAGGDDNGQDAAMEIIASIMVFLSSIGCIIQQGNDSNILAIPEIYDVIVQIFSLLLVLLSTQLYQPMVSSAELAIEGRQSGHFFLEKLMEYSRWQRSSHQEQQRKEEQERQEQAHNLEQEDVIEPSGLQNETILFLHAILHWFVNRPLPPRRSIASHYVELPKSIAKQMTNMALSPDGMYESHSIVMASVPSSESKAATIAAAPTRISLKSPDSVGKGTSEGDSSPAQQNTAIELGTDDTMDLSSAGHVSGDITSWNGPSNLLFHPLRSLLLLSSTFFLLPIRLVRLAINLLGHSQYRAIVGGSSSDGDKLILQQLQAHCEEKTGWNKTNNILWLTDSPIADLGSALVLILSNNCRSLGNNETLQNPFRAELSSLKDNRWDSDTSNSQSTVENSLFHSPSSIGVHQTSLSANFESLFEAFGRIAHTEVGALLLYTLIISSPALAESIAARSDLDTLVMPLLRTLYFSTAITHIDPGNKSQTPKSGQLSQLITLTPSNRPFRSQSQLYVILILLLIFSQDPGFGRDSFRRVQVSIPAVKWYKERQIKEASLGSMILLVLLRATTFNLNRLQDGFLLSNCCAVLLNLSPHIVDLHHYVATRLASVAASCFKRYTTLLAENGGVPEVEGDLTTLLGLHGETCRTLLQLIRHSIRPKYLEKNIHLVYALLLEQKDLKKLSEYPSLGDTSSITELIETANAVIEEKGDGFSADQTLGVLKMHMVELKSHHTPDGLISDADSVASDMSDLGNLTFTYEEEADPEVFFVPYVWDVIVGTLTTTTMEWSRNKIQVFPLNEEAEMEPLNLTQATEDDSGSDVHDNTPDVV